MGALKQIKQFQLQISTVFPFTYFEKVLIFQYLLFYKELVKTEGCISMHLSLLETMVSPDMVWKLDQILCFIFLLVFMRTCAR